MDHSAIYFLIAGTYTPITLGPLRGPWGWSVFGVIWGLAIFGIVMKAINVGKHRTLSTMIYVGMGWMILIALKPLLELVPANGLWLLLAGGLSYSVGWCSIFSKTSRMDTVSGIFLYLAVRCATSWLFIFMLSDKVSS